MGFIENLSEKISSGISTGAGTVKTSVKNATETVKINSEINANTNQIDKLMKSIGVAVKSRLMDQIDDEEVKQLGAEIDALVARNTALSEQLNVIRGVNKCSACGKDVPGDSAFCPYCGGVITPVIQPEVREPDTMVFEKPITPPPAQKICPSCGYIETPDAIFCSSCGGRIG